MIRTTRKLQPRAVAWDVWSWPSEWDKLRVRTPPLLLSSSSSSGHVPMMHLLDCVATKCLLRGALATCLHHTHCPCCFFWPSLQLPDSEKAQGEARRVQKARDVPPNEQTRSSRQDNASHDARQRRGSDPGRFCQPGRHRTVRRAAVGQPVKVSAQYWRKGSRR